MGNCFYGEFPTGVGGCMVVLEFHKITRRISQLYRNLHRDNRDRTFLFGLNNKELQC